MFKKIRKYKQCCGVTDVTLKRGQTKVYLVLIKQLPTVLIPSSLILLSPPPTKKKYMQFCAIRNNILGDFPVGSLAKTLSSRCRGPKSILDPTSPN